MVNKISFTEPELKQIVWNHLLEKGIINTSVSIENIVVNTHKEWSNIKEIVIVLKHR